MTSDVSQVVFTEPASKHPSQPARATGVLGVLKRHVKFLGPGVVASAAYYDPGNWATDLQAGSEFGNIHLFVLLLAIILAIFLQILATRLGFVSRKDISQNCRKALYSRKHYTVLSRWVLLYPLWLLLEIGVLFADVGELLGSAIAFTLLVPQIPIWAAVLMTFPEIFLALLFFRGGKESKRSMRVFEIMITLVVMAVVISSLILLVKVEPNFAKVFQGFIPSVRLVSGTSFYTAIGIVGATVGPHSLILGATMATQDRSDDEEAELKAQKLTQDIVFINPSSVDSEKQLEFQSSQTHEKDLAPRISLSIATPPKQRTVLSCKSYLAHASFDIAASIFTLPLIVNSAILAVASTSFYFTQLPDGQGGEVADIFAMHNLLKTKLGPGLATLFALSLLLSGQAASLTVTMAGQSLSAGFLDYHTSPLMRRLVTRTLGIIPSVIVSALLGKKGIGDMLIAVQVGISVILPFTIIPLAYFTGKREVMSIPDLQDDFAPSYPDQDKKLSATYRSQLGSISTVHQSDTKGSMDNLPKREYEFSDPSQEGLTLHSFANNLLVKFIVGMLIVIVVVANAYGVCQAIVEGSKQ